RSAEETRPTWLMYADAVSRILPTCWPCSTKLWPGGPVDGHALSVVYRLGLASDAHAYLFATEVEREIAVGPLNLKNSLWQREDLGHVDELVGDGGHRGRGMGSGLLNELIALARRRGYRRLELDSALHREAAHRPYECRGFESRASLFSKRL